MREKNAVKEIRNDLLSLREKINIRRKIGKIAGQRHTGGNAAAIADAATCAGKIGASHTDAELRKSWSRRLAARLEVGYPVQGRGDALGGEARGVIRIQTRYRLGRQVQHGIGGAAFCKPLGRR